MVNMIVDTSFVLFCCVSIAYGFIDTGRDVRYRITLDIFSGRPNPTWVVDATHRDYDEIAMAAQRSPEASGAEGLGYRGFYIESSNAFRQHGHKTIGAGSDSLFEEILFDSNPDPLHNDVRQHFVDSMHERTEYPGVINKKMRLSYKKRPIKKFCKHPRYNPEKWNIVPRPQWYNNCYNYASQRRTDTFAQPGRATGQMYSALTAYEVMSATIRDGFIYLPDFETGREPEEEEEGLCFMALVIWPGMDYHFYRMDNNYYWSHKPGGTRVRDYDRDRKPITDPRTANRGPYIIFAGFVGNHWDAAVA